VGWHQATPRNAAVRVGSRNLLPLVLGLRSSRESGWFFMFHSLLVLATKVVEVLFFVGISGCVLVVAISWVSIFKEGFKNSDDQATGVR